MPSFMLLCDLFDGTKYSVMEENPDDPGVYSAITPPWSRQMAEAGLKNARQARLSIRTHEAYSEAYDASRSANLVQYQMILDFKEGDKDNV